MDLGLCGVGAELELAPFETPENGGPEVIPAPPPCPRCKEPADQETELAEGLSRCWCEGCKVQWVA